MSGDGAHRSPLKDYKLQLLLLIHRRVRFADNDEIAQLPMARFSKNTSLLPLCALRHCGLCRPALLHRRFHWAFRRLVRPWKLGVSIGLCAATGWLHPGIVIVWMSLRRRPAMMRGRHHCRCRPQATIRYALADCWLFGLSVSSWAFKRHLKDHGEDGGAEEEVHMHAGRTRSDSGDTGQASRPQDTKPSQAFASRECRCRPHLPVRETPSPGTFSLAPRSGRECEDKEAKDPGDGKHQESKRHPRMVASERRDSTAPRPFSCIASGAALLRERPLMVYLPSCVLLVAVGTAAASQPLLRSPPVTTRAPFHLHLVAQGHGDQDLAKLLG